MPQTGEAAPATIAAMISTTPAAQDGGGATGVYDLVMANLRRVISELNLATMLRLYPVTD